MHLIVFIRMELNSHIRNGKMLMSRRLMARKRNFQFMECIVCEPLITVISIGSANRYHFYCILFNIFIVFYKLIRIYWYNIWILIKYEPAKNSIKCSLLTCQHFIRKKSKHAKRNTNSIYRLPLYLVNSIQTSGSIWYLVHW